MKKLRKIFLAAWLVLLLPVLVLGLSGCGNNGSVAETKSLYAQGLEVVRLMSEVAGSEEYMGFYTDSDAVTSAVQNISAGDYTTPKAVYAVSVTEEALAAMTEFIPLDNFSEEVKTFLMQRVLSSLFTQVNALGGAEKLAASSVCMVEKVFVNESANRDVIYLYTYDNTAPAAVTFTVGEDGAVLAKGAFVLYDGFTCESADEIKSFFRDVIVEVTEVFPEK